MSLPAADPVPEPSDPSASAGMPARPKRLRLAAVLAVYACMQFLYIMATPLQTVTLPDNLPQGRSQTLLVGLGPDETEHFLYVLSLADGGALPMPDPSHRTSPRQYVTYQAQHRCGQAAPDFRPGLKPASIYPTGGDGNRHAC